MTTSTLTPTSRTTFPSPGFLVRLSARSKSLTDVTHPSLAPGHIQANLLVLPSSHASSFLDLCARNPVPCPLLAHSTTPGDPHTFTSTCGALPAPLFHSSSSSSTNTPIIDIRTDIPKYNIYHAGQLIRTSTDILDVWTPDSVAFLIGCSFSFEDALAKAGLPPRHWDHGGGNVPMYRTKRKLDPAGVFVGADYVVSMRPYAEADVERVRDLTRRYRGMHGEPIAWGVGAVEELGIRDLEAPEWGERVEVRAGEVPVFWGCGVTAQNAIIEAGDMIPGLVMAHAPGHMLVLDVTEGDLPLQPSL